MIFDHYFLLDRSKMDFHNALIGLFVAKNGQKKGIQKGLFHHNAIKLEANVIPGMGIEKRNPPPDSAASTNNGEASVPSSQISQIRNGEEESKKSESADMPSTGRLKTGNDETMYTVSADDVSLGGGSRTGNDGTTYTVSTDDVSFGGGSGTGNDGNM